MSRRRRVLFRLVAAVGIPLLMLLCLEVGLRLGGAGYPTGFFIEDEVGEDGTGIVRENPQFTWRFFPRALARPPMPLEFKNPKPEDTIRIFILGESAAKGDPMPEYGFGRCLQVMLEPQFPEQKIEIINTAVTAINSHVIRDIARDCLEYEPDLVIAYIGNNEVVGPYGPGTVLTPLFQRGWSIRAHAWMKRLKIVQIVSEFPERMRRSKKTEEWLGMEHFIDHTIRADDPRLEQTYALFENNIKTIVNYFKKEEIPVVLCTVPVNLADCPPFGSAPNPNLSQADEKLWRSRYLQASQKAAVNDLTGAYSYYKEAHELDDTHAQALWEFANIELGLNDKESAGELFQASCDHDTLRFRADSRLNNIIKRIGTGSGDGVSLSHLDKAFAKRSTNGIPGEKLFYEHVHMNFAGQYQAALAIAQEVLESLGIEQKGEWLTENECALELGFIIQEERRIGQKILKRISRAPFTEQSNNAETKSRLLQKMRAAKPRFTLEEFSKVTNKRTRDTRIRQNYGIALTEAGRPNEALPHFEYVTDREPNNASTVDSLARCWLVIGNNEKAEEYYRRALEIDPKLENTGLNLSLALVAQGKIDAATNTYRQFAANGGSVGQAGFQLARQLRKRGARQEALKVLETAIDLNPSKNHYLLQGFIYLDEKWPGKAEESFKGALDIDPEIPEAYFGLGRAAEARDTLDEAGKYYKKSLEINPAFGAAKTALAKLQTENSE